MENVAWRSGVTIVLLVAVALAGPRTGQGAPALSAAQAQATRYLAAAGRIDGAWAVQLPWCPGGGEPVPERAPRVLDVEWLGGSPLTRQDGPAGARMARLRVWAGDDYTFYLALPGTKGPACDWAVLDVQRHVDTQLAQAPR